VVGLESISKEKKELNVRNLGINSSPIPYMKIQFLKGVLPSLHSSHFFIKSFVLFPSQTFCSPSCGKTHFNSKILFKNHLSQSVIHCFREVGWISPFSIFKSPFSHISQAIILHGHYNFNAILFDDM